MKSIKETLTTLQEDKSVGMPWLEERTILLTVTGSFAYGTNTEQSDHDYKGICIPPKEYFLGLKSFNEYNSAGGKNFKNTKEDVDIAIIHISKFVKDAMVGVPNNIEMLFVRESDLLMKKEWVIPLLEHRHLFLSKSMKRKFGGYARAQIERLKTNLREQTGRVELVEKHGYDTKLFMHAARLLTSATEILETGTFSTYRPNRTFLLDCRNGKYALTEALSMLEELDDAMNQAYDHSFLPENPDYQAINQLLMEINERALN
jgi:predicted nucleotidyltransferase